MRLKISEEIEKRRNRKAGERESNRQDNPIDRACGNAYLVRETGGGGVDFISGWT